MTEQKNQHRLRGAICAAAGGACWGFSGTVGQFLFSQKGIDSQWLTMVRLLGAGVILLIVAFFQNRKGIVEIWSSGKNALRLVLFGVFGLMVCQYTYLTAIYYSNSATATVLQYLGEVMILAYTCLKLRRLPSGREWLGVLLAVAGVFLLATHGDVRSLSISPKALFWGIAAAVGMALYTLLPGDLVKKYGCPVCTGSGMLLGGIAMFLLVQGWTLPFPKDAETLFWVAVVVVVGTAAAFSLYIQGASDIGGVKAGMLGCSEPVCAAVISALWLGTDFKWQDILAFAMVIAMVFVMALPGRKKAG